MGCYVRADDGTSHYVMHDPTSRHRSVLRHASALQHRRSNSLDATCAIERDDDAERWHQLRMISPLYRSRPNDLPMMPPAGSARFASFPQMPHAPALQPHLFRNQSFPFPGSASPYYVTATPLSPEPPPQRPALPASRPHTNVDNIRGILTPKQLSLLQEASKLTGTPIQSSLTTSGSEVARDVSKRSKYWTLSGPRVRSSRSPTRKPSSVRSIQWEGDRRSGVEHTESYPPPPTTSREQAPVVVHQSREEVEQHRRLPPRLTLPPPPQPSPSPPPLHKMRFFIGSEASTPASPTKRDHFTAEAFARHRHTSECEGEPTSPFDSHRDRAYSESSGVRRDAVQVHVDAHANSSLPELVQDSHAQQSSGSMERRRGVDGSAQSVSSQENNETLSTSWSRPRASLKLRKSESAKYRDRNAHPVATSVTRRPESFRIARPVLTGNEPTSAGVSVSLNAIDRPTSNDHQLDVTSMSTGQLPVGKSTPPLEFLRELEKLRVQASLSSDVLDSATLARL